MSVAQRRIWLAGGGTGGHLYPGLAIARALVRLAPEMQPHFIGAHRGIEQQVLPTTEFSYTLLDLHPLYRKTPWNNWRTVVGGIRAWRAMSVLAAAQCPVAVIGTGGYAAGGALAWARTHGVPTILHEPDSHPGLTTRAFAGGARAVYLGFPEAAERLAPGRQTAVHALGCPIEPPVPQARAEARQAWGLESSDFVLLVVGGSQGARAINEVIASWVDRGLPDGVAVIWATGRQQAAAYLDREGPRVRVRPYLAPIAEAYAAADIAVARAGAMSIAELCAWGIPSVLVPLPTAAQDHQTHNARATAGAGAAYHLPQSELSVDRLEVLVREWSASPAILQQMRAAARRRARPDAAEQIARSILATLG